MNRQYQDMLKNLQYRDTGNNLMFMGSNLRSLSMLSNPESRMLTNPAMFLTPNIPPNNLRKLASLKKWYIQHSKMSFTLTPIKPPLSTIKLSQPMSTTILNTPKPKSHQTVK